MGSDRLSTVGIQPIIRTAGDSVRKKMVARCIRRKDPALIQTEIDRRREAARKADRLRRREEELRREKARVEKSGERLVTAYQEGIADSSPTTAADAAIAETNAGRRIGITISKDDSGRPGRVPTIGREPGEIPNLAADSGRSAGHRSPTADCATAGEGGPGRERHHYPAPFHSDFAIRTGFERMPEPVLGRHWIRAEPKLSFAFEESCHRFVRYADDCSIYVRSERARQRVMESITQFITQKLKLKVNEAKDPKGTGSAVARPQERKFLGFSFTAGPEVKRVIAPKALDRLKQRIREIRRRAKGGQHGDDNRGTGTVYAGAGAAISDSAKRRRC